MTEQLIDLTKLDFWLAFTAALLFVGPLSAPDYKKLLWALVNVGFIVAVLHWHSAYALGAVAAVYLVLQGVAGNHRLIATLVIAAAMSGLFFVHKSPALADLPALAPAQQVLSVIGYSYIFLRMVELLRAVFESRHPPPSLASTINYLVPFHMLAAGPIQAYDDFAAQPVTTSAPGADDILSAVERIVFGLFKKFVLAYLIQQTFLTGFQSDGLYFFIEVQLFFLWLYLDFSAYSDIAVGIGRLTGVPTPENFNRPYLARNIIDFWDRWHITLSHFIRRNIFIPLQLHLNRRDGGARPLASASVAFMIAFIACGLWHGLTMNFMLWGVLHGAGLIVSNLYRQHLKRRLGARGVKRYLANKPILYAARFLCYQYVAFSLVVLFIP